MNTCPRCGNELQYSDDCVQLEASAGSGVNTFYVESVFCAECFYEEVIDFRKVVAVKNDAARVSQS